MVSQRTKKIAMGFTLLEMLLVLAVMSAILVMLLQFVTQRTQEMRRDRLVLQIQQILSAGLSYYINNGYWPTGSNGQCTSAATLDTLKTGGYLPASFNRNPYQQTFNVSCQGTQGIFTVTTIASNATEAQVVAGRLPIATATGASISASVTIPGQNLNNARAVNFANLYRTGGCVPAPTCPNTNMTPEIFVVPVSVSGLNDPGTTQIYPISSFTGYAYGDPATNAPVLGSQALPTCEDKTKSARCIPGSDGTIDDNIKYWRVCLNVVTSQGDTKTNPEFKKNVTLLAVTRCAPPKEPSGSGFNMYP